MYTYTLHVVPLIAGIGSMLWHSAEKRLLKFQSRVRLRCRRQIEQPRSCTTVGDVYTMNATIATKQIFMYEVLWLQNAECRTF